MNMMERGAHGLAVLRYLDGEYQVVTPGVFVICAVTGKRIPLEDLRYWNVDLQEAYVDATAAHQRYVELTESKR
ncbi:MAG: DUF2093 domain-containing protein [Alphaproteobacteria bacterium]|nr:DUF2093 domain-containing protein [Alphaproteobacteria bacterium]